MPYLQYGSGQIIATYSRYVARTIVQAHAAKILKGFSSRMLRKNHTTLFRMHLWGKELLSGYFYRTVGIANLKTVKRYVEASQKKHWKMRSHLQKSLYEFNAG